MIDEGSRWHAGVLADAARTRAEHYRGRGSDEGSRSAAYCQGIADAVAFLLGGLPEAERPTELTEAYRRYLADLDLDLADLTADWPGSPTATGTPS